MVSAPDLRSIGPGFKSHWRWNSSHDCLVLHCREPFIIILPSSQYDLNNVIRGIKHQIIIICLLRPACPNNLGITVCCCVSGDLTSIFLLQIMKNRFDGQLGVMMLKFDKESLRFVPTQKKSLSQKTNEKEEEEEGQELDISVGSRKTKKTSVTRDRKKASETSDLNEAVKFVKLGETGHDFETVLNIDKYYS